jgi:hypothetical protein
VVSHGVHIILWYSTLHQCVEQAKFIFVLGYISPDNFFGLFSYFILFIYLVFYFHVSDQYSVGAFNALPSITVSEASRPFLIRKPRLFFFFSPVFLLFDLPITQQEQASPCLTVILLDESNNLLLPHFRRHDNRY